MSSNLRRIFSSVPALSAPKLPSVNLVASALSIRLVSSSIQQPDRSQEDVAGEGQRVAAKESPLNENEDAGIDQDDEDGGVRVNKASGEIDGPKGPEPTRYGDWERNGRCYDF